MTGIVPPADPKGQAFLLLLIGSVAGLLFMFLPRKKEERGEWVTVARRWRAWSRLWRGRELPQVA